MECTVMVFDRDPRFWPQVAEDAARTFVGDRLGSAAALLDSIRTFPHRGRYVVLLIAADMAAFRFSADTIDTALRVGTKRLISVTGEMGLSEFDVQWTVFLPCREDVQRAGEVIDELASVCAFPSTGFQVNSVSASIH